MENFKNTESAQLWQREKERNRESERWREIETEKSPSAVRAQLYNSVSRGGAAAAQKEVGLK